MNGRFIVLEGGEGSGKSTLAAGLARRWAAEGVETVLTREPGGTIAGELVRALLHEQLSPWAETFAFLTARAQLVAEVIEPALARGATVVCDRFAGSTFAYQGYGRGLDLAQLRTANNIATGGRTPDTVLFLDLDPAVGLARKHGEAEAIRTGLESLEFHKRVREGYRTLAQTEPGWHIIDASQASNDVEAAAWRILSSQLTR